MHFIGTRLLKSSYCRMSMIRNHHALAKTLSFAIVHFTVAFGIAYLLTGSVRIAGALALVEPLANTVAYYGHERFWQMLNAKIAVPEGAVGA